MTSHIPSARPGAANTGAPNAEFQESAAVKATALILAHTHGGCNHAITVRRNPHPRHRRDWLVSYNNGPEVAIKRGQLRSIFRFRAVLQNVGIRFSPLNLAMDPRAICVCWQQQMDDMMRRIGGGA